MLWDYNLVYKNSTRSATFQWCHSQTGALPGTTQSMQSMQHQSATNWPKECDIQECLSRKTKILRTHLRRLWCRLARTATVRLPNQLHVWFKHNDTHGGAYTQIKINMVLFKLGSNPSPPGVFLRRQVPEQYYGQTVLARTSVKLRRNLSIEGLPSTWNWLSWHSKDTSSDKTVLR